MTQSTAQITVATVENGTVDFRTDTLAVQTSCTLNLNGKQLCVSVCSPGKLLEFARGFMVTEGFISCDEEPVLSAERGRVVNAFSENSTDSEELHPVDSDYTVTVETVFRCVAEFVRAGEVFRETGATHSAAVCVQSGIKCLAEDVSRSVALDKAVGCALINGIETGRCFAVLSSRVHSAFVEKFVRAGIPIVAAVSAPTVQAVEKAEELGVCLCGFVRGKRMNVYSCRWRLGL